MLDPTLQPVILTLTFVVGLCIGSFLNVVGLRFLSEESISAPASKCPDCQTPLKPYDNIPVLSYLLLGGQCRACKTPISIQYPLVELVTGLLFTFTVWNFDITWQTLLLLFLVANLVVITITDLRESLIFQINSLSLVPAGLIYSALNLGHVPGEKVLDLGLFTLAIPDALISAIIAIIGAIVFFEGMILLSQMAFGTEGFGHGDTHLMMGVGAYLGWELTLLSLILGFIVQTIPAIPMLVIQWIRNKQYVSLTSGSLGVVFGAMPLLLTNISMEISTRTVLSMLCLLFSLVALVVFLRQVKQSQSFTYLPLGPALVVGSLIALFWGRDLLSSYLGMLH